MVNAVDQGSDRALFLCGCSAGVGRTGVFITLSIVLERMRYEGAVDIFQTVKMLRTQRPAMVQTEVKTQLKKWQLVSSDPEADLWNRFVRCFVSCPCQNTSQSALRATVNGHMFPLVSFVFISILNGHIRIYQETPSLAVSHEVSPVSMAAQSQISLNT